VLFYEQNIKHEHKEDVRIKKFFISNKTELILFQNEPSELGIEEDHEDETSDANQRLDFPASTSTNLIYPIHPISTKSIVD